MSCRKTGSALGLAGVVALSAVTPSMASMPTAVAAIKTAPQPISSMCAGAGGRGSESALDWACLEQRSHRRITMVTAIRMPATMVVTATHMPMVTMAATVTHMPMAGTTRGRTMVDGDGGIITAHGDGATMGTATDA